MTAVITPKQPPAPSPLMTPDEARFLESRLLRTDVVFEWGSGSGTLWLAERVKFVTSVEHSAKYAADVMALAPDNVSIIYAPPEPGCHWRDRRNEDGELSDFSRYVDAYTGKGVTAVLIDGRARRWCARRIVETADYGPHPGMRVFAHDANRSEVAAIWEGDEQNPEPRLRLVDRVGNLALLEPVFE